MKKLNTLGTIVTISSSRSQLTIWVHRIWAILLLDLTSPSKSWSHSFLKMASRPVPREFSTINPRQLTKSKRIHLPRLRSLNSLVFKLMISLRKSLNSFSACSTKLNQVTSTTIITMKVFPIQSPMWAKAILLPEIGSSTTWWTSITPTTMWHLTPSASTFLLFITETPLWIMSEGFIMIDKTSQSPKSSLKALVKQENLFIRDSLPTAQIRNLQVVKGMAGATAVPTPSMLIPICSTLLYNQTLKLITSLNIKWPEAMVQSLLQTPTTQMCFRSQVTLEAIATSASMNSKAKSKCLHSSMDHISRKWRS